MENEKDPYPLFWTTFVGEKVSITINQTSSLTNVSEMGTITETFPVFYEGILLDMDEEFLYLGKNPNEINQAVKRIHITHIMVNEELDQFDEILNEMEVPEKPEDVN